MPNRPVPLGMLAGQAIPLVFIATILLWGSLVAYTLLSLGTYDCGGVDRLPHYRAPTLDVAVPVILACCCIELLCWRYIVVSKYQVLRQFKIIVFPVRCRLWFAFSLAKSGLKYYQFVSVGNFFGTTLAMGHCAAGGGLFEAWEITMNQSSLAWLPYWDKWFPRFTTVIYFCMAMILLQLIFALAQSIPMEPCKVDYEWCIEEGRTYQTRYKTLCHRSDDEPQNHGAALMSLCEANGMALIVFDDLTYALSKAHECYETKGKDYLKNVIMHCKSQLRKGFQKSFLAGTLWNGVLLNLQVTLFAFSHYVQPKSSVQALAALLTTLVTSTVQITDGMKTTQKTWEWYLIIKGECQATKKAKHGPDYSPIGDHSDEEQDQFDRDLTEAVKTYLTWWLCLVVATAMSALIWLYAATKLVAAFLCKESMWNVTGCVEISRYLSQ